MASSRCARARRGGSCSSAAGPGWRRSCACSGRWPRRAWSGPPRSTTARARRPTSSTSRSSPIWRDAFRTSRSSRPSPRRPTATGPARPASSPRSSSAWRTTSPTSTPTSAVRRRWWTPRSRCSSAWASRSPTSTSTSSRPPNTSERGASMATDIPVKERSVPKPVFTDAEAGAKGFPSSCSRSFNYFPPRKRRATVYEDVTVDVQPDPARYLSQGWVYAFANGDAGYPQEWTVLKSSNWHEFLDPNEEWEQTIYRNNAAVVRQIQQNVEHGRLAHVYASLDPAWVKVLEKHVFAWAHAEHGIGMHVYTPAQRDAPTNMINNAMAVGAAHKLRFAQDLILYNLTLSEEIQGFKGSIHKQTWQEDPVWQLTRQFVERLTGTRDWAEQWFATAIVFEPLLGELFRSGFVMQVAALHGDFVTPTIMGAGESDAAREQRGARALFRMLASDDANGTQNGTIMQGWLDAWAADAISAARQLQPIWSQISEKVVRFEDSLERSRGRLESLVAEIGLETPKEVKA